MSFVRPRELMSFDPRHVTRFPPIRKRILVGRYIKTVSQETNVVYYVCHIGVTKQQHKNNAFMAS